MPKKSPFWHILIEHMSDYFFDYFLITSLINDSRNPHKIRVYGSKRKLMTGIEPVTPSLPRKCSTSEPHQRGLKSVNRLINIIYKRFLVNCFLNFPLSGRMKLNLIHAFQNILKFPFNPAQRVINRLFFFPELIRHLGITIPLKE